MNPRGDATSQLFFLYENLFHHISTPPASWNADEVRDFTIICNHTGKLMNFWNDAIRETADGQGLSPGRRSSIITYLTQIIFLKDNLQRTLNDMSGQYLLKEMDIVLDEVGAAMDILCVLEDTA